MRLCVAILCLFLFLPLGITLNIYFSLGDNLDDHVRYFNEENGGKRGKDLEKAINQARVDLLGLLKKAQNDTNLGKNKETRIFLKGKMNELARKTSLVA